MSDKGIKDKSHLTISLSNFPSQRDVEKKDIEKIIKDREERLKAEKKIEGTDSSVIEKTKSKVVEPKTT